MKYCGIVIFFIVHTGHAFTVKNTTTVPSAPKKTTSWSVQVSNTAAPTIYSNPKFATVQKTVSQLSQLMNSLVNSLKQAQQQNIKIVWSVNAQANGAKDASNKSNAKLTIASFDYQGKYKEFQRYINDPSASYMTSIQDTYGIYQNLYPAFQAYLSATGQQEGPSSQMYFVQYPFQNSSYFLSLVKSITAVMIQYLSARSALLTSNTYRENNGSSDLFGDTGAFQFCDTVMTILQNFIGNRLIEISKMKGISSSDLNTLQSNCQAIFTDYVIKKNTLVIQTVINVLQALSQKNQSSLVSAGTKNNPVATIPLENFMVDVVKSQEALNQIAHSSFSSSLPAMFLGYPSVEAAVASAHTMLANLYVFNSVVLSLNMELAAQSSNTLPYSISDPEQVTFQTEFFQSFFLFSQMLTQAANHASGAGDNNLYTLYASQVNLANTLISSWQNGQSSYNAQSYVNALNGFNAVLTAAQQLNLPNFAIYILTIIQKINLEYEQTLFELYVEYPIYLSSFETYLKNAITTNVSTYEKDQALWSLLWYPPASPIPNEVTPSAIYKGFYPLCNSALQTIQSVLTSVNLNQLVLPEAQVSQLQNALKILMPLVSGLEEMMVKGALFPDKQPADSNMYINYYTPAGYREVYVQYQSIIQSFDAVDRVFAEYKDTESNPYVPLEKIFSGQQVVNSFGKLVRLHYARWAFCMGMYAINYASSKSCLTDKLCIAYQNTSYQYALCALTDARRMYAQLGYSSIASFIQTKITSLKQYAGGLVTTASTLVNGASSGPSSSSEKAYYDALYFSQIAALVDGANYESSYKTALQYLINQESSNAFSRVAPSLHTAYLAYQGYLWALYKNDVDTKNSYASSLQTNVASLIGQISTIQKQVSSSSDIVTSIASVNQLQTLQTNIQNFAADQQYQQGILNISNNDFVSIVDITSAGSSVVNKTLNFLKGGKAVLANVTYNLSQLYVQQGTQLFAQLQNSLKNKKYNEISDDVFLQIFNNYSYAIDGYSRLGLSDKVIETNKLVSRAMAFYYYSLIIASDAVNGSLGISNQNDSSQSAASSKNASNKPLYLLRSFQQNLTNLKKNADQNVDVAQKQNSKLLLSSALGAQASYDQVVSAAQALVGSKNTSAIISQVLMPLYKSNLVLGNYQGIVRTIDQQVEFYIQQIQFMATTGMSIGGVVFKTSLSIVEQDNGDGTTSLILKSYYIPVSPLPQFVGDATSALIIYTQYQKFFQQTTQPIQLANGIYSPIPDLNLYKSAQTAINQTYIAAGNSFNSDINALLKPVIALKNSTQASFDDLVITYSVFNNVYQEIFACYSALDELQQSSNILSFNMSNLYVSKYQEYGDNSKHFLVGNPSSSDYIARATQIATNYLLGINYTLDTATQGKIYKLAGDVYKRAGDLAFTFTVATPSSNGYPSLSANNFPVASSLVKTSTCLTCNLSLAPSSKPKDPLTFYGYKYSQGFYQQALRNYQKSYLITHKNQLSGQTLDTNIMTTWGLYLISAIKHPVQNVALFGRNAFTSSKDADGCDFSDKFLKIQASGAGSRISSVQQGYSSLTGIGGGQTNDPYSAAQYGIMKNLVLDALIYLSGAVVIVNELASALGVVTGIGGTGDDTAGSVLLGTAYLCSIQKFYPTLTALYNTDLKVPLIDTYAPLQEVNPFSFESYLGINQKYAMFYCDGFVQYNDYVINQLFGTGDLMIKQLKQRSNVVAISNYILDLYSTLRTVYANAFLSQVVSAAKITTTNAQATVDQVTSAIASVQQSIDADMMTAQQNMLVNASGYVG